MDWGEDWPFSCEQFDFEIFSVQLSVRGFVDFVLISAKVRDGTGISVHLHFSCGTILLFVYDGMFKNKKYCAIENEWINYFMEKRIRTIRSHLLCRFCFRSFFRFFFFNNIFSFIFSPEYRLQRKEITSPKYWWNPNLYYYRSIEYRRQNQWLMRILCEWKRFLRDERENLLFLLSLFDNQELIDIPKGRRRKASINSCRIPTCWIFSPFTCGPLFVSRDKPTKKLYLQQNYFIKFDMEKWII